MRSPHNVADKAARVRTMFNNIAGRYERTNTICSGGRDASWRRKAVALANIRRDDDVLDVACGTGDLTRAFAQEHPRTIIGCDFAHEMLLRAAESEGLPTHWVEADALKMPFPDRSFSLISCAFGVRNFVDLDAGLREFFRLLRLGGRVVILEFSRPEWRVFRLVYELYANYVMPRAASWISGDHSGAYRYLPRSVVSFPGATQMCERLSQAGFTACTATSLTFGVVNIYRGTKLPDGSL